MSAAPKIDVVASAARRLAAAAVGIRERRRFRRMPIEVNGRLMDLPGREHDCRTVDISPGDIRIAAPVCPLATALFTLLLAACLALSPASAARAKWRSFSILPPTSETVEQLDSCG
ncbi:MAG: hypothetical protein R3C30_17055 [Hyphomonadaceae bacterium]